MCRERADEESEDRGVKLFLSCVSDEFGGYRNALRRALTRPNVEVKIQEDFKSLGGDTLSKLEEYIARCEAVVHFVGEMTGSAPPDFSVKELLARRPDITTKLSPLGAALEAGAAISYSQWEAWLALYLGKDLEVVTPAPRGKRARNLKASDASRAAQSEHLARLRAVGVHSNPPFTNQDNLVAQIITTSVIKALVKAATAPARQPRNLPFASLGPLFLGRDADLDELSAALAAGKEAAVVGRALHGLGGVGKTRLAIEYAWRHEADYSALLFVRADDPATLDSNFATLAAPDVLDLAEKEAPQDATKTEAALRWLDAHPTWLMILDNVDDERAVAAVGKLMARLKGGHAIVTARAANFPLSLRKLELGVLDEDAATAFLLERTRQDRTPADDDADKARELARELDGLALGLEQAGAYVAAERIGLARYLALWRESRQKVLEWADATLMSYDRSLATTWATSVARLSFEGRRLLDRLAMLAPDPIPDSLIEAAVPGEAPDYDALKARAGLYAYSMITRASGEGGAAKGFVVHRLVQDFARRAMTQERYGEALREALAWLDAAFFRKDDDARYAPELDPLAPHALAVVRWADQAGLLAQTGRLLNNVGLLFRRKGRFGDAEPLFRRAVEIEESVHGPDHPVVAVVLGNLAELLVETGRLSEAEPLMLRALAIHHTTTGLGHPDTAPGLINFATLLRTTNRHGDAEPLIRSALAIDEATFGRDHPRVARDLNHLAGLLGATDRIREAEPLSRRALAIYEARYGSDDPDVAVNLNNLAGILRATNRLAEAEPLYRRALAIDEAMLGPSHPHVAIRLSNLALLLAATDRLSEAEPLARRAVAIDKAVYGADHPYYAIELNNLAEILRGADRFDEAEPLFRRALAIDEASLGSNHPNVAIRLNNLSLLLRATNRLRDAVPLQRRALKINETSYGPNHPNVATNLNNLASMLQSMKQFGEAERLYRRALAIFRESFGANHPNTTHALTNLAGLKIERAEGRWRRR